MKLVTPEIGTQRQCYVCKVRLTSQNTTYLIEKSKSWQGFEMRFLYEICIPWSLSVVQWDRLCCWQTKTLCNDQYWKWTSYSTQITTLCPSILYTNAFVFNSFFSLLEINAFYEGKIAKTKLLSKWVLSVVIFQYLKIQIAAPRFWNKQIRDDPKECWYDVIISITETFNWIIKKMKNVPWPKSLLPFKPEARSLEQVGYQYLLSSPDLNNRN